MLLAVLEVKPRVSLVLDKPSTTKPCLQPGGCTESSPRDRYLSYFSYCTSPHLKTTELRCRKATRVHKASPPAGREVRRQPVSNLFYHPSQDPTLHWLLFCRAVGGRVLRIRIYKGHPGNLPSNIKEFFSSLSLTSRASAVP